MHLAPSFRVVRAVIPERGRAALNAIGTNRQTILREPARYGDLSGELPRTLSTWGQTKQELLTRNAMNQSD